jgi:hypothetical protein
MCKSEENTHQGGPRYTQMGAVHSRQFLSQRSLLSTGKLPGATKGAHLGKYLDSKTMVESVILLMDYRPKPHTYMRQSTKNADL